MSLFSRWFATIKKGDNDASLWLLTEKVQQREQIQNEFCERVRSHYDDLNNITDDIAELGYEGAAKILKERLPMTTQAQSGELGEIMATEFTEENLGFKVPVRRIRYKDGRNMALRGDDFIGVYHNSKDDELILLKGESKSNANLSKTVIGDARTVLNRDDGRCTPISLLFVADRLLEGTPSQKALGRKLRNDVALKAMGPAYIHHAFFTLTGNDSVTILEEDLAAAEKNRIQNVINIRIPDHQSFIKDTYEKVGKLGNN